LRNYSTDDELHRRLREEVFTEENGVDRSSAAKLPKGKPMSFYYDDDDFLKLTFSFARQETWTEFMGSLSISLLCPE
jgi:hypothetical protein